MPTGSLLVPSSSVLLPNAATALFCRQIPVWNPGTASGYPPAAEMFDRQTVPENAWHFLRWLSLRMNALCW